MADILTEENEMEKPVRRADYKVPEYFVEHVDLFFKVVNLSYSCSSAG